MWYRYEKNVMARNVASARYLTEFYESVLYSGKIPRFFEVVDLQRYKKYVQPAKVRTAMAERPNEPFVFFPCKN